MRVQDLMTTLVRLLTAVIVTIGCSVALVAGQEATPQSRGVIERGHALFEQNCSTCHGKRGKGDARGAATMNPRPTDLTTLSKRYGAFPAERIAATLKGTDQTKAHSPTMMAWKALFLADANGNEATADVRVKEVVAFIASLQVK
jgi:mono/diheme cytochrome c family protein